MKKVLSYKFASKTLYIAMVKAYANRPDTIRQELASFDWGKFVDDQGNAILDFDQT